MLKLIEVSILKSTHEKKALVNLFERTFSFGQ